ncbi:hypothetical protein J31TS4_07160 [Paenibacillus sp. J31TS4]|nr:hypothetical protein J31TS4_07160 [Paenibacillus sp. J31TS4]
MKKEWYPMRKIWYNEAAKAVSVKELHFPAWLIRRCAGHNDTILNKRIGIYVGFCSEP